MLFNSPFARFHFRHLPFGLCSAPEVFQAARVLEGLASVKVVILIWGTTKHEHDERLKKVQERINQYGVKFDKCVIGASITFLGDRYSAKGIKSMAEIIEAICPAFRINRWSNKFWAHLITLVNLY